MGRPKRRVGSGWMRGLFALPVVGLTLVGLEHYGLLGSVPAGSLRGAARGHDPQLAYLQELGSLALAQNYTIHSLQKLLADQGGAPCRGHSGEGGPCSGANEPDHRSRDPPPPGPSEPPPKPWAQALLGGGPPAGPGLGAAGAAGPGTLPLVTLGIPTVPRPKGASYLGKVIDAIAAQLPQDPSHPLFSQFRVMVMNVHGPGHAAFDEARRKHGGSSGGGGGSSGGSIVFLDSPDDAVGEPAGKVLRRGSTNTPGPEVRKQTRDLVALMRAARGKARHYLFLEDDMLLCDHGVLAIHHMLRKAYSYHPDWISVRASYGMNGILLKDADVGPFADYLLQHHARRPPDHLVVEWFAGEKPQSAKYKGTRPHVSFRYNILDHLGVVSTLRTKASPRYPRCFEELDDKILFKIEAFNAKQCPDDDLWPCSGVPTRALGEPRVAWDRLHRGLHRGGGGGSGGGGGKGAGRKAGAGGK